MISTNQSLELGFQGSLMISSNCFRHMFTNGARRSGRSHSASRHSGHNHSHSDDRRDDRRDDRSDDRRDDSRDDRNDSHGGNRHRGDRHRYRYQVGLECEEDQECEEGEQHEVFDDGILVHLECGEGEEYVEHCNVVFSIQLLLLQIRPRPMIE